MAKIITGSFLVLLGLSILFQQSPFSMLGIGFGNIFSLFWLVIGVILLTRKNYFWGFLFSAIGLVGFVSGILKIDFGAWIFPLIIIAIGFSILFKKQKVINEEGKEQSTSNEDLLNESIVFSGLEKRVNSTNFKGGKVDSVFSGIKIDLTNAKIAKEGAELEINSVFGGVEVITGKDQNIISNGTGVFGAWTNKFSSSSTASNPKVLIKGAAVFGGVEIKN